MVEVDLESVSLKIIGFAVDFEVSESNRLFGGLADWGKIQLVVGCFDLSCFLMILVEMIAGFVDKLVKSHFEVLLFEIGLEVLVAYLAQFYLRQQALE